MSEYLIYQFAIFGMVMASVFVCGLITLIIYLTERKDKDD